MDEKKWQRAFFYTKFYNIMLAILTAIVAAFWLRDQMQDAVWQSLGLVALIMLLALFLAGWALSE